MVAVTTVNLLTLATSLPYANQLYSLENTSSISFLEYDPRFSSTVLGPNATATLVSQQNYNAFHEAGVYSKATNSIYIASNYDTKTGLSNPINVSIYHLDSKTVSSTRYPGLASPNGGCTYIPPSQIPTLKPPSTPPYVLWCDEGDFNLPSALVLLDTTTNKTTPLLTSFLGHNFSSVNDIKQHPVTGDVWFTDAYYGWFQAFRPPATIPSQVYRYEPSTGRVYMVADGFIQSNGLEFSPDLNTLYITDTGAQLFSANFSRPATIYAFDVVEQKYARNRRVFAYADSGIPDGIHTDTMGNVWSSCGSGDGLHVWDSQGTLLGKIVVPYTIHGLSGGTNNFAFLPGGVLIFNAEDLWLVECAAQGREVARDFGLGSG